MRSKNNYFLYKLEQLPLVSLYAKTRGWPYIMAWGHPLTGIILVSYACFHVYTLSLLETPSHYDTKMQIFSSPLFVFFEWLLAVPVIFHALNGGRLILYESFGNREDNAVIKWLSSFSALYLLFLGILMIAGNQSVSALFFWFAMLASIVRLLDPREKEKKERLKILYSDQGLYRCHSSQACSFVCPKEINVSHFMALAKAGEFNAEM
jgi:succinate dehydrogenase hydrophobic anchor subunit